MLGDHGYLRTMRLLPFAAAADFALTLNTATALMPLVKSLPARLLILLWLSWTGFRRVRGEVGQKVVD